MVISPARAQDAPPNFEDHIKPIFTEWCIACHRGSSAKNGLVLNTMVGIREGGSGGAAIVPGDAAGSLLYQVIAHTREPFMPYMDDKMADDLIATIGAWIDAGAPENVGDKPNVAPKPRLEMIIDPAAAGKPAGEPAMPRELRLDPCWWTDRGGAVNAIAASPWAPLIAVGGFKQVSLYHAESLALLGVLEFPEGSIHTLQFSRDGALLIVGGGEGGASGRVVGYDVTNGDRVFEIGAEPDLVLAADLSADKYQLALGGPDGVVRIYNTIDGALMYELDKHTDWVTALRFSPDGVLLATGDRAGNVHVWEAGTGREFHTLPSHNGRVASLDFRPDSMILVTAGEDGAVRAYEMENGGQAKAWNSHGGVLAMRFAPNGQMITSGRDGHTRLWNADGAEARTFEMMADIATATALTHDASRAVVGDLAGNIHVFNAGDGALLGTVRANPPTRLQFAATQARQEAVALEPQIAPTEQAAAEALAESERLTNVITAAHQAAGAAQQQVNAAQAALDAAKQASDAVEAEAAPMRTTIAEKQASLTAAEQAAQAARKEAAAAEQEMLAATGSLVAAENALRASPGDPALQQTKAAAEKSLAGASAIAQIAAEKSSEHELALKRARAEHEQWLAIAQPIIDHAAASLSQLTASQEALTVAETAAQPALEQLATVTTQLDQATQRATATTQALEQLRTQLLAAQQAAKEADAAWAAQKAAIEAAGGIVDSD